MRPEAQQVLPVVGRVHQQHKTVENAEEEADRGNRGQHVALQVLAGHLLPADPIQVVDVGLGDGSVGPIRLVDYDGDDEGDDVSNDAGNQLPGLVVLHEQGPEQVVEVPLVDELVEDEESLAQDEAEKYLVCAVHAQVEPGDGHRNAQREQVGAPEPVLVVADDVRYDGLVEQHHCETMAAGVAEVQRAEPLQLLDLSVDPEGPGLLEGLLQERNDKVSHEEVGQVNQQEQLPPDHDVVGDQHDADSNGVAGERGQVLHEVHEGVGLPLLELVDQVEADDEEWGLEGGVEGDHQAEQPRTDEEDDQVALAGDALVAGGRLLH